MPQSRAQLRLAHEVLEGKSDRLPPKVAQEMVAAFHGHSMDELPERSTPKKKKLFPKKRKP